MRVFISVIVWPPVGIEKSPSFVYNGVEQGFGLFIQREQCDGLLVSGAGSDISGMSDRCRSVDRRR